MNDEKHFGESGPQHGEQMPAKKISHYEVHNRKTGEVRKYKTGPAASRGADRMDNAYGSYIAHRKPVYED